MAKVIVKRGSTAGLEKAPLKDGLLSITTDDGRVHIDYVDKTDSTLKRKTLYGGKLTFGPHVFDGTEDVTVQIYDGAVVKEGE